MRRYSDAYEVYGLTNFNPRTPCGVRQRDDLQVMISPRISIHAPLAGCDAPTPTSSCRHNYFNPRTPCGVRRTQATAPWRICAFQSTHPLRGATGATRSTGRSREFQSTHPLRGATRAPKEIIDGNTISIHAPLAGCDDCSVPSAYLDLNFNPRTPCGVRHIGL